MDSIRGLVFVMVLALTPTVTHAQGFFGGLADGLNQGRQYSLQKERLALQRQQMKLQQLEQWRGLREQELRGELQQWAQSVKHWRIVSGQPPYTQEEGMAELDRLRVWDWERAYEQTWLNAK